MKKGIIGICVFFLCLVCIILFANTQVQEPKQEAGLSQKQVDFAKGVVDKFEGYWVNISPKTAYLTAIEIGREDQQVRLIAWDSANQNDMKWGKVDRIIIQKKKMIGVWSRSHAKKRQFLTLQTEKRMSARTVINFTDVNRDDFDHTEIFEKRVKSGGSLIAVVP